MGGNLTALFGRDAYNSYGHHLNSMPFIRIIEAYLLIAVLVHMLSAGHFTLNKRKAIAKSALQVGLLALTGTVLSVFAVTHVKHFRFAASTRRWRHSASRPDSPTDRDLYADMLSIFVDPKQVAFYVLGIAAVAIHLHKGWAKTVLKMEITKEQREPITRIGQALIYPLCFGFSAIPLFMYGVQQEGFAAAIGRQVESAGSTLNATGEPFVKQPFVFFPSWDSLRG